MNSPVIRRHFAFREQKTQALYQDVSDDIKSNALKAWRWAKNRLALIEGDGHRFVLSREKDGSICCAFAKPEWAADHCGKGMKTAAEAIVIAVCEYEHGY